MAPRKGAVAVRSSKRNKDDRSHLTGRYPFLVYGMRYLEKRKPYIAESTYRLVDRTVRYLNGVAQELKKQGKLSTTNPSKFTQDDVAAWVVWAKATVDDSTAARYFSVMKRVCAFAGNPVFDQVKAEGHELPRQKNKELWSLEKNQLDIIQKTASSMKGWYGEIAKLLMYTYPCTGVRPSELRLAHLEDVDTTRWIIFVRHPKGEGSYAKQRHAPILPPARQPILNYLKAREKRLNAYGFQNAEMLIPVLRGTAVPHYYAESSFRRIKKKVQQKVKADYNVDLDFCLKTLRDTYCQMILDKKPELLSDVSLSMGHSTTSTTERHYGRMKMKHALDRIQAAFEDALDSTDDKV